MFNPDNTSLVVITILNLPLQLILIRKRFSFYKLILAVVKLLLYELIAVFRIDIDGIDIDFTISIECSFFNEQGDRAFNAFQRLCFFRLARLRFCLFLGLSDYCRLCS